jgi:hypothetical protein
MSSEEISMADTSRTRGFIPALSLLALAGALFGVITAAQSGPGENVELVLNMSHSTSAVGGSPIVAP